jgi:hypothetical protein
MLMMWIRWTGTAPCVEGRDRGAQDGTSRVCAAAWPSPADGVHRHGHKLLAMTFPVSPVGAPVRSITHGTGEVTMHKLQRISRSGSCGAAVIPAAPRRECSTTAAHVRGGGG